MEVEQGWSTSLEASENKCDKKVGKEEVANTGGKGASLWCLFLASLEAPEAKLKIRVCKEKGVGITVDHCVVPPCLIHGGTSLNCFSITGT